MSRYIVYLLLSTINIKVFTFNELLISSSKNSISSTFYSRDEGLINVTVIIIFNIIVGNKLYYLFYRGKYYGRLNLLVNKLNVAPSTIIYYLENSY